MASQIFTVLTYLLQTDVTFFSVSETVTSGCVLGAKCLLYLLYVMHSVLSEAPYIIIIQFEYIRDSLIGICTGCPMSV